MTLIFRVISTGLLLSHLLIPLNIPVKDFWSVIVYDIQTRSMLQTDQEAPSVSSQDQGFKLNADGSVDDPRIHGRKHKNQALIEPQTGKGQPNENASLYVGHATGAGLCIPVLRGFQAGPGSGLRREDRGRLGGHRGRRERVDHFPRRRRLRGAVAPLWDSSATRFPRVSPVRFTERGPSAARP